MYIPRIIALTIGFIAGIVAATFLEIESVVLQKIFLGLFFTGVGYSAWTLYQEYHWKANSRFAILFPLLFAGVGLGLFRASSVVNSTSPMVRFVQQYKNGNQISFRGQIVAEPELRSSATLLLRVRIAQLKAVKAKEWLNVPGEEIRLTVSKPRDQRGKEIFNTLSNSEAYGYTIQFTTGYSPPQVALNPGGFNMEAFLLAEGCVADLKVYDWRKPKAEKGEITEIKPGKGFFLMEWSLAAKRSFIQTYKYAIAPPACRLISGATLGTRYALRGKKFRGKLIEDFFHQAGVGHVLAVSGLHISVVSLLLFSMFKMTRIPPKYFAPVMILLLFSFTLLTGARPSSLRATIMNIVIILVFVYGGAGFKRATYAGLSIAALLILFRRPMVLYSAGFLLSFGAVLSLILITPPVDKVLKQLRGATFGFVLLWYVGLIAFASLKWEEFLRWPMLIMWVTILAFLLWGGGIINWRFPTLLKFRFNRIPDVLRLFLCAQVAIQFGMMIPLSAYFFGNFPIAGMFVNILAIPLVGVIVQLGILIGLAGMLPFIGEFLALILGAANWLVGSFFMFVAWLGSEIFPYPPVPKPSPQWVTIYYLVIFAVLSAQLWYKKAQNFVYKKYAQSPKMIPVICTLALILTGSISSYQVIVPAKAGELMLDIPAGTNVPVVVVTGDPRGAVMINSGNRYFAKKDLKSLLLARGAISIYAAIASGRAPNDGSEGFAVLAEQMVMRDIYYPAFVDTEEEVLTSSLPFETYVDAIGIDQLPRKKQSWIRQCHRAYIKMLSYMENMDSDVKMHYYQATKEINLTNEIKISPLTSLYETYPAPVMLTVRGRRILIVGDPGNRKLEKCSSEQLQCDILVLGAPIGSPKYYVPGLKKLKAKIKPEQVIFCLNGKTKTKKWQAQLLAEVQALFKDTGLMITETGEFSKILK